MGGSPAARVWVGAPRSARWLVAAVAIAASTLLPASAWGYTTFGFNENSYDDTSFPEETRAAVPVLEQAVDADVQRITLSWNKVEKGLCNLESRSWAIYDQLIGFDGAPGEAPVTGLLEAYGIRPVIVVMDSPKFVQGEIGCGIAGCRDSCAHVPPGDRFLGAWHSFVNRVATRYPEAAAIEVWNEPNANYFWQSLSGPDPAAYTRLFRTAADAVHLANQANGTSIPVLTGGLVSSITTPGTTTKIPIETFLQRFYDNGGRAAMAPRDAISVHAYVNGREEGCLQVPRGPACNPATAVFDRVIAENTTVRDRNGDRARRLWITETGTTTTGTNLDLVTPAQQAEVYRDLVSYVQAKDDVDALLFHTLIEPHHAVAREVGYGIVKEDLTAKPAYCALAEARGQPVPDICPAPSP